MTTRDELLATRFSERRAAAEAFLWREMNARGLRAQDGWKIMELTRDTIDGSEMVLRPLHLWQPAPADVVCVIRLDADHAEIHSTCEQDHTAHTASPGGR
jgi:hypothetical protein